jgi:hypothetical protein
VLRFTITLLPSGGLPCGILNTEPKPDGYGSTMLGVISLTAGTSDMYYKEALQDVESFNIAWSYFSPKRSAEGISYRLCCTRLNGLAVFCTFSNWMRYVCLLC